MLTSFVALALLGPGIQLERNALHEYVIRVVGGAGGSVAVYVDAQPQLELPSVLGKVATLDGDLLFTPRFPFEAGRDYRVEFSHGEKVVKVLRIPRQDAVAGAVVQIYPTVATLPANQLKLYIQFSVPMARGVAYRHIRLLDDRDREVPNPFLELAEELWDSEQRRFTLLFDPGRVKRDLVPNREAGAPLEESRRYTLEVNASWPSADGASLRSSARKEFTVGAADREAPDHTHWAIAAPVANTSNALAIDFREPMDYGLLLRTLRVLDENNAAVPGIMSIANQERIWRFTPTSPWAKGLYRIEIGTALEDLAGNRIGRLFDVDTRAKKNEANRPLPPTVSLTFDVIEGMSK